MARTHYDLLGVAPGAATDEIKHAFRREIARYHPDKVQHLGQEFQDIAAVRAAELTQAYKTLTDAVLRADYDALLGATAAEPAAGPVPSQAPAGPPEPAPPEPPGGGARSPAPPDPPAGAPSDASSAQFSRERAGARQFVSRAALARFRAALEAECPGAQPFEVSGFDAGCLPRGSFLSFRLPPRILARQVTRVDPAAIAEAAAAVARLKKDGQRDLCLFLLGQQVAPAAELAGPVADLRRRAAGIGGKVFVVPVDTDHWRPLVPAEAPDLVRAILTRLKP